MTSPLQQLYGWGLLAVAKEGDRISLTPQRLLTDERRDFVRQNRLAILDELRPASKPCIHYITAQPELLAALRTIEAVDAEVLGLDIETFGETLQQHVVHENDGTLSLATGIAPGQRSKEHTTNFSGGLDARIGRIRSVQISTETDAWVFDLHSVDLNALKAVLETRHFVAYNAAFEHQFLRRAGLKVKLADAMLMDRVSHGVVNDKFPYRSLAEVSTRELGITLDKTLQSVNWGSRGVLTEEQIHYAAMDATIAARLYPILKAQLEKTRQWGAYLRLERVLPAVADMMLNGIGFDVERCSALSIEWTEELDKARHTLEATPELASLNLNSSKQKERWLRAKLGDDEISRWPKTKKGGLETGADTLLDWKDCPAGLVAYLRAESLLKQFRTFFRHVHPITGRIHAQFQLAGALSGRYCCRAPNLQNPPSSKREARFRELFVAKPGNVLVGADFSQIELRIAAAMAPEPTMKRVFQSGEDLHSLTASKVLGVDVDDVSKEQRSLAKALNFGLLYGMGPNGFREYAKKSYGLSLTLEEASRYRAAFFAAYPGLKSYHQRISDQLYADPIVKTRGGLWVDSKRSWTKALNSPIQGTGAEVFNEAIARIAPALDNFNARLVHVVHDEILLEVANENAAAVQVALAQAMEEAFEALLPGEQLGRGLVDPAIGCSWGGVKGG